MYTDTNEQPRFAPGWKPSESSELAGEITEISTRDRGYGAYPIITILEDDGNKLAFHAMHSVARRELGKLRPEVGERISVVYDGKKTPRSGRGSYHGYTIAMDRPATPFDWGYVRR